MEEYLTNPEYVQNNILLEYFLFALTSNSDIADYLWACTPFHPIILKDIVSSTPRGICKKLVARFVNTKTVGNLAGKVNNWLLSSVQAKCEIQQFCYFYWRMTQTPIMTIPPCVTVQTHRLRCTSWKRNAIEGVTYPSSLGFLT